MFFSRSCVNKAFKYFKRHKPLFFFPKFKLLIVARQKRHLLNLIVKIEI